MIGIHKGITTDYFDGARGIAVLFVWLSHSSGRGQEIAEWLSFHGIGHVGVMLFFVLSGYLLSMAIVAKGSTVYQTFMLRRFLRIAPMYYIVLFSVFLWQIYTGKQANLYLHIGNGLNGLLRHLLFIQGDGIFWTISAEFVFYLILPIITIFLMKGGLKSVVIIIAMAVFYSIYHFLIYANIFDLPGLKIVAIKHISQFLDVFLIGVVFGYLSQEYKVISIYKKYKNVFDIITLLLFLTTVLATLVLVSKRFLFFYQPFYLFRFLSIWYAIVFGISLLSAHLGNNYLRTIFRIRIFIFCGIVGYSWYLLHMPVIAFINSFGYSPIINFILSSILISIVSLFGYKIIEEPFIKFGKKVTVNYHLSIEKRHNYTSPTIQ